MNRRLLSVPVVGAIGSVFIVGACSYYDTGLLKFSDAVENSGGAGGAAGSPNGGNGGASSAGANAGGSGSSGGAGGSGGTGVAGMSGGAGAISSGGGGGNAGNAGQAGGAGSLAGGGVGGSGGASGGAAGTSGGASGNPSVCVRATLPPRPTAGLGGGGGNNVGGAGGNNGGGANGGGAGGSNGGGANVGGGGANVGGGGSSAGSDASAGTSGASGASALPLGSYLFAARTLSFDETGDPAKSTLGFDLDGVCTCLDTPAETCLPPKTRPTLCDGPGGRDNSFPRMLKDLITFGFAKSSQGLSQDIENGKFTLLLRVDRYNGLANDDDVRFAFYIGGNSNFPAWQGQDPWTVLSTSVEGDDVEKPRVIDDNAYVSNGQLVATLPTFDANDQKVLLQLNSSFAIALTGAVVVMKLEPSGAGFAVTDGTLAGRWRDKDFFTYFSTYRPAFTAGQNICTDSPLYPSIKKGFCDYADLSGNLSDVTGSCTATSLGARFTAVPARFGPIEAVIPATPTSCPAETDPATDSCAK